MKCPNCNAEVKDEMKFCPKCGGTIPQIRYCRNCGTELKQGMRFCSSCGFEISNQVEQQVHQSKNVNDDNSLSNEHNNINSFFFRAAIIFFAGYALLSTFGLFSGSYEPSFSFWPLISAIIAFLINYVSNKFDNKSIFDGLISKLCLLLIVLSLCGGLKRANVDNSEEFDTNEDSSYAIPDESDVELAKAENDLLNITDRAYSILPKVDYVMRQYGYSPMGYLTASQNNPQLFREFENVISDYNRCLYKMIRLCEKKGLSEMAESYRIKQRKWDEGCRMVKGMP